MSSKARLYIVAGKGQKHLVNAANPAAARSFVARAEYSVKKPEQHEVWAMARDGIEIEYASEELSEESLTAVSQTDLDA